MTSALPQSSAQIGAAISRYQPSVRHALRGAGVRASDVEDLSQDVFAIFCRRYAEIAEPAQRSFLQQTARRVAADHRRLKWNQALFLELPIQAERLHGKPLQPPPALGEPASEAERRQLKQLMIDALSVLPDPEKRVFLLTHSEGLSRTEISALLAVPAGTVASRLRRANQLYASCIARMDPPLDRVRVDTDARVPWRAPGRGSQRIALPARSEILHGKYVACDNQWGHARCAGFFDQCLLTRQVDGETQLGWTWNWSTFEAKGFALPELIAGWKPWSGGRATDSRFPVPLANIAQLAVDFDVELRAEGAYNLLIDLWFLRSAPRDAHADPDLISREVMIDFDYSPSVPRQHYAGTLELLDHGFEIWLGQDAQGVRLEPWPSITLCRRQKLHAGRIDLAEILAALTQRGLLVASEWLGSVEFGNCIFGGEGETWVRHFEVELELR